MTDHILTPKAVEAAKPAKGVKRIREKGDAATKGFFLQVSPSGTKSWGFSFTSPIDGSRQQKTFGSYPAMSLSEARSEAIALRTAVNGGIDPFAVKAAQIEAETVSKAIELRGTVDYCFKIYAADCAKRGVKTFKKIERTYTKDIKPYIGDMQVKDLTVSEVKFRVYEPVKKRGSLGQINKIRSLLRSMINIGLQAQGDVFEGERVEFGIGHNPIDKLPKGQDDGIGQRFLTWEELKRFWETSGVNIMSADSSLYFKLAFALGGQRVETLLHAEWSEIDFEAKTFSIPLERRKMGYKRNVTTAHAIPLSDLAISLLEELKTITGSSKFLFPKPDGKAPRSSDSIRQSLDRYLASFKEEPFAKFNPRDIRRTCKTLMIASGIDQLDTDKLQDHAAENSSSNVNYNKYDYQVEKERCIDSWTNALTVFGAKPDNVTQIKQSADVAV